MKNFNVRTEERNHLVAYSVDNVASADINEAVYAAFCVAGQTVLAHSTCFISGERSASELAGDFGWHTPALLVTDEAMVPEMCIKAGDYQCSFLTENMFATMAEWEGVCGITAKQAYRFHCEAEEGWINPDAQLKPYRRDRVYRPKPVSVKLDERRINAKFEVLGQLVQSLTSEGMKKAMSLLTAIKSAEKLYSAEHADMAAQVMRRWFWDIYGTTTSVDTIPFSAKDFQYGPECWKVVDEDYVKELLARWKEFVANNPAPEWIKRDDLVQLKNQAVTPKKWQGALKVYRVYGQLNHYCNSIEWYAEVCTTKGKWDSLERNVDTLELFSEQEPVEKPAQKSQKAGNNPKPTIPNSETKAAPSVADLLLQVLAA